MSEKVNLNVDDADLALIISRMEEGRYRIPEFQREYVWETSEVTELFDSIYNSYPVGSLFLWEVPEEMNNYFRDMRDLGQPSIQDTSYQISFVLDGQQRLTSLYVALKGLEFKDYDYSRILFDIDAEEFTLGKASADHLISVADIWDESKSLFDIAEGMSQERQQRIEQCSTRLRNYKLPLIEVESEEVDSVIDIFERINQKGRDLDRFDIVNANVWTGDFNLRQRIDKDIVERLEENDFGTIERDTVAQAISLCLEGQCTTNVQKNLDAHEVSQNWDDLRDAFLNAVRYIRGRYNIQRVEFLPYESLIAILTYYMYKAETKTVISEHQEKVDQYFWRVVVSDHWESMRQTTIGQDTDIIDEIIAGYDADVNFPLAITPDRLINGNIKRSKSSVRNAFLCVLANKRPLNPEDGTDIDLKNDHFVDFKLEKHHIFPNSFLLDRNVDKDKRKSLVDITFLPKKVNNEIGSTAPSEYFEKFRERDDFEDVMFSHIIPYGDESAIWTNDYDKFLEQRATLIMEEIQELVGESADLNFQDQTPEQRMKEAEEMVREVAHNRLQEEHGDSYWDVLPSGVVQSVNQRINGDGSDIGNRKQLEYISAEEASTIITTHWANFDDIFPEEDDVEHHLKNLEAYRREYEEEGEVDRYTRLDGDLAIQWINSCVRPVLEEAE
ncbi:GmrSD restriction endonuclease domain-containing protein [Halorientalis pallida]|uniref:GmrSD restriction endonuclease domain-containing protein n=1 Tax=Halorientalis pallida TaxID=2479928 RepID=UPI003C703C35